MKPLILVVDDDPMLRRSVSRLLSASFELVEVETVEAAWAVVLERSPSVILCDLDLPGASGVELWQRLQSDRPALLSRFVLMTGGSNAVRSISPLNRLDKPFTASELREMVDKVWPRPQPG